MEMKIPCAVSLVGLLKSAPCFIVRMKYLDNPKYSNRDNTGDPIWPEVLVARSESEADTLCKFLNEISFSQTLEVWQEEDPQASRDFIYERWRLTDPGQYVVEFVPDLSRYPDIYRLSDSLMLASEIFEDLQFSDEL